MLSDSYPIEKIYDGFVYRVKCTMIAVGGQEEFDIGANPSEDPDNPDKDSKAADAAVDRAIDVVHNFRLAEQVFTKKDFSTHLRTYVKELVDVVQKEDPSKLDAFKKATSEFAKEMLLGRFDEMKIYSGENCDPEGALGFLVYEGETPYYYLIAPSVKGTKF